MQIRYIYIYICVFAMNNLNQTKFSLDSFLDCLTDFSLSVCIL